MLILLPAEFVSLVEYFGLLHVVRESCSDAPMSMVAFKRTTEIDWRKVIMEGYFFWYDLNGG